MVTKQQKDAQEGQHKPEEALHFSEDRMLLLDTVSRMIDIELDRREQTKNTMPAPEKPPPRRSLRQRLLSLFSSFLL